MGERNLKKYGNLASIIEIKFKKYYNEHNKKVSSTYISPFKTHRHSFKKEYVKSYIALLTESANK